MNAHPRIVYIISQLRRGGAEQQLYYLLAHFRHNATVVVLEHAKQDGYWVKPIRQLGYEVIELDRQGHRDLRRLWRLTELIGEMQADVVHIFNDSQPSLYGRLATIISQSPRVIINERRHPSADPRWYQLLKRWLLNRYVSAFVTNSRSSIDYATEYTGIPESLAYYIPNGIDLQRFRRNSELDTRKLLLPAWRDRTVIGTVGSLLPKKGPGDFVKVARRVVETCPNTRFLHVGQGPMQTVVNSLRNELGLHEHIHFLGGRSDVPQLLQAIDIFVMTSRNEGMPNAIMEAMAMGLPCVVTDTGDSKELVRDGENGFVVAVGDIDALSERILWLVKDGSLRKSFGKQSHALIQGYSLQNMAEQYRKLYSDLLADELPGMY